MQWASWIGGGTPRWIIVILLSALVWHWCGPRCAVALGGASLLSNLASSLLKLGFGRARPDLIDHLDHVSSASYPRGHATSRSEEHTSELQSLMRNSYAVFCLKKKNSTHQR